MHRDAGQPVEHPRHRGPRRRARAPRARTGGCSHPNYVAVAVEGAALPLVHTAWVTALAFTVLNAILLLGFRIPTEERALRSVLGRAGVTPDVDLLVVGGGPVGLAVAIEGRLAGLRVIVVEPRATPVDKACGEGLMPGAVAALARLGVRPARAPADRDPLRRAATASVDHLFAARARARACDARRCTLALAIRAEELGRRGARREGGHRRAGRRLGDRAPASGPAGSWRATGCTRPSAGRSGSQRPDPARGRRYGVRRHYRVEPWTDLVEVHWGRHVEAYVTPVADGRRRRRAARARRTTTTSAPSTPSLRCAGTSGDAETARAAARRRPAAPEDAAPHGRPRPAGRRRLGLRRRAHRRGRPRRAGAGARRRAHARRRTSSGRTRPTRRPGPPRPATTGCSPAACSSPPRSPLRRSIVPTRRRGAEPVRRRSWSASRASYQGTGPDASVNVPVGAPGASVAARTVDSAPCSTVCVPRNPFRAVAV